MTSEKSDTGLIDPRDPLIALGLLSRLPLPVHDGARGAGAAWAYPLAGLVIGALAALAGWAGSALHLPAPLIALVALATLVMLTGAMHEDGLADTADGLWGGWDAATRLEIMRDSRIGTYGVIALCLSLAARWGALWLLYETGMAVASTALVAGAVLSRAAMPVLMTALPHARKDGLSHHVGGVAVVTVLMGLTLALIAALLLVGPAALRAMVWVALVTLALALIARRKIGGQTGDILGATQQLSEIVILWALVV